MIRRQFAIAAIVINLLLVIAAAASAQTPLAYRVEDIATLGGSETVGLAINSHGGSEAAADLVTPARR